MRLMKRNLFIIISGLVILLLFAGINVSAQTGGFEQGSNSQQQKSVDTDSREFDQFVEAYKEIQEVMKSVNEEVDQVIMESSLEEERFMEIHQEMQAPNPDSQGNVSDAEQQTYREVMESITEIQSGSQSEMVEAIEDNNLSIQRYNEIVNQVQRDPELQESVKKQM